MEVELFSSQFFVALFSIIILDLVLAGDNAVVIAMASNRLPAHLRKRAIYVGTAGAIVIRLVMTFFAVQLLSVPYLQALGGLVLLPIAVKLMKPSGSAEHIDAADTFVGAVKTIIIADAAMGIDNVIAIAGASHGDFLLVVLGLIISIPIVVGGSQLIGTLMERYPVLVVVGTAILGWTGGAMIVHDRTIGVMILEAAPQAETLLPAALAGVVCSIGGWLQQRG
ncbi:TerC family protein [uncultured Selenomonas sp.]|uniref:TerC family protein n=1 Tax=uncultured Selenomonas sp. TaxID=159275 RepID=UPI0028D4AFA4|nr:TerC family protein [uncultured Selenomonas sp.]